MADHQPTIVTVSSFEEYPEIFGFRIPFRSPYLGYSCDIMYADGSQYGVSNVEDPFECLAALLVNAELNRKQANGAGEPIRAIIQLTGDHGALRVGLEALLTMYARSEQTNVVFEYPPLLEEQN